jgi:hypothetical protein
MPLDLTGKATDATLARIEQEGENAIEGTVTAEGEEVRASVEVSRTTARWSVAAFAEWAKTKGWSAGSRGKWKF